MEEWLGKWYKLRKAKKKVDKNKYEENAAYSFIYYGNVYNEHTLVD
jgi:hypothetical protein